MSTGNRRSEWEGSLLRIVGDEAGQDELNGHYLALESENGKLRDLVRLYHEYCDQDRCTGCVTRWACDRHLIGECWMHERLSEMASELGVGFFNAGNEDGIPTDVPMYLYQEALEDYAEVCSLNDDLTKHCKGLDAENAGLRDLVRDIYESSNYRGMREGGAV